MAFNGNYYIKVGNYPIPLKYMFKDSYKVEINTQDLNSYRDADGILHRNVLPHQAVKLSFDTPIMTNAQFRDLIDHIRANMTNKVARDVNVNYYNEETDSYKDAACYMPGTFEYTRFNKNIVEQTRIAFIEY